MSKTVEEIKEKYKKGMSLKLINMDGEPQMKCGLTGIVDYVDDIGQIHVNWSNGSTLALNVNVDEFEVN